MKTRESIETVDTQQELRNARAAAFGQDQAATPPNAPEQRHAGFAAGEASPAKYPEELEIGRFSTGQDESEPIKRGCFAEGQETEPKAIDPDEGFAERQR
jgi:hypothetical protein